MKTSTQTLHFTFGPVQDFVSQARKTRDLWAGSYLLSYLSGKAMLAIINKGGEIISPNIQSDGLFDLINNPDSNIPSNHSATRIGSLPNRFTAKVPAGLTGEDAAEAITASWRKIADNVRNLLNKNKNVIDIHTWDRQINDFWEFQWVMGESDSLLDQRKNMRCHLPDPEPGEKCTICGERKELSKTEHSKLVVTKIDKWWMDNIHAETISDLHEGERLCAVCLTKRLFPLIAQKAIGWPVSKYFPSTSFMAAIDWLDYLLRQAQNNPEIAAAAKKFAQTVRENTEDFSTEYHTMIPTLEKTAEQAGLAKEVLNFDGNLFHSFTITDDALHFKQKESPENIKAALMAMQVELKNINPRKSQATPFYALLLMDGDGMGKLLSGCSKEQRGQISGALAEFTRHVPDIVLMRNGWLIYAGGDDVFALLPVEKALECAMCCRAAYQAAFCRQAPFVSKAHATISAAVQYAHMKTPLGPLVKDAHRLLDDIAKEKTGRDAVACRVWKRGGPILTWAQPWEKVITTNGSIIDDVRRAFQHDSDNPTMFSSKFFYKLKDLFEFINVGNLMYSSDDIRDLLAVEYLANREHTWDPTLTPQKIMEKASRRIDLIMTLSRRMYRHLENDSEGNPVASMQYSKDGYIPDGALLVRFLSQKEV